MLAGLPKAPRATTPAPRRTSPPPGPGVLEAMVETAPSPAADGGRLGRHAHPAAGLRQAGYFADWALEDLAETFPGNADLVLARR